MSVKIGSVEFDGNRGHIQLPRPQLDYYTRLGDEKIYVQKVNTSSQVSTVQFWSRHANISSCEAQVTSLIDVTGKSVTMELASGMTYPSAYLIDFTYNIRKSGCEYLLEVEAQIVTDKKGK